LNFGFPERTVKDNEKTLKAT